MVELGVLKLWQGGSDQRAHRRLIHYSARSVYCFLIQPNTPLLFLAQMQVDQCLVTRANIIVTIINSCSSNDRCYNDTPFFA